MMAAVEIEVAGAKITLYDLCKMFIQQLLENTFAALTNTKH